MVYTGSHGVMELDDIDGKKVSINLNLEIPEVARLPAPRYVFHIHNCRVLILFSRVLLIFFYLISFLFGYLTVHKQEFSESLFLNGEVYRFCDLSF